MTLAHKVEAYKALLRLNRDQKGGLVRNHICILVAIRNEYTKKSISLMRHVLPKKTYKYIPILQATM